MAACTHRPALTGPLTEYLHTAAERGLRAARGGVVSTQIPALADVPATKFAMAVAGVDGTLLHTGDSTDFFSIQSLSKLFALCALLRYDRGAWQDIGWGPTNAGYGSVADLERSHGRPANPFVNSGAIVVTDRLISHTGDVYPSGFLPVKAGNIREDDIIDIYRTSPIFRELRDRTLLKGKCGVCGFRDACGGSRARAYAMTGDHLAEEPFCAHVPPQLREGVHPSNRHPVAGPATR